MMNSLRIGVAAFGLLVAAFSSGVQAGPIVFFYELDFTSGPLAGQHIPGNLSVDGNDCLALFCTGVFAPNSLTHTLLSLDITVAGTHFAMSNDGGFPAFPHVTFNSLGHLASIDYQGVVGSRELDIAPIPPLPLGGQVFFRPNTPSTIGSSLGNLVAVGVPEPGTAPLLGAALLAALVLAWQRRKLSSPFRS